MKQVLWWSSLICFFIGNASSNLSNLPPEVSRPPKIRVAPEKVVYAIYRLNLTLPCIADAVPAVANPGGYRWEKDGKPLDVVLKDSNDVKSDSIVMSNSDGTILFRGSNQMSEIDLIQYEGVYRCFATNKYGTAVSSEATVKAASAPYQVPQDVLMEVVEGNPLELPCSYNTADSSEVRWNFNGKELALSDRISQKPNGGLVFANVIAGVDDGLVYCTFKDLATRKSTDGKHFTLSVLKGSGKNHLPEIIVPSTNEQMVVLLGDTIRLSCIATGRPTPVLKWDTLSGDWDNERTTFEDWGKTVIIKNATSDDAKTYRCQTDNSTSGVLKLVTVQIEARPYFTSQDQHPTDTMKAPGANATIRCNPEGIPPPTVEWRINGELLSEHPAVNRVVDGNVIKLTNLQKNDSSVYQCFASNKHGSVIKQGYVNVLTWPPIPRSGNIMRHREVEGKTISIKCKIFASPHPAFTWIKDGISLDTSSRIVTLPSNHLRISGLRQSDGGIYSCTAQNEHGVKTLNYTLEVLRKTKLAMEQRYYVPKGNSTEITAQVTTDSVISESGPIDVIWSRNGVELFRGNSYRITNATFNDAGDYRVKVTTGYDTAHKNFKVIVTDRPSPPQNFSFDESDDDPLRVLFSWQNGNNFNSPIVEYRIEFEEKFYQPGVWHNLRTQIDGNLNAVEALLSPGIFYRFRAFAKNGVGWSLTPSSVTDEYKTPDARPNLPTNVKAFGTQPSVIEVTWTRVNELDRNAPGFGYRISYKQNDSTDDWMVANLSADTTNFKFRGDLPYQAYIVRLTSFNNEGDADADPVIQTAYTGEDVPTVNPTNINVEVYPDSPTNVSVSWKVVDENLIRGLLLGYNISCTIVDQGITTYASVGNVNSGMVQGLRAETVYSFRVAAYNRAGNGPFSKAVNEKTPRGAPFPGTINVTVDTNGAIVTWTPSAGLPAEKVFVEYKMTTSDYSETEELISNGDAVQFVINDLKPNTHYKFRVKVSNEYGEDVTESVTKKTPMGTDVAIGSVTSQIWFIIIMCLTGLLILIVLIICFVRRSKGGKYSVAEKEQHIIEAQNGEISDDYKDEIDDVKKPLNEGSSNGKPRKEPMRTRGDSVGGDSIEDFVGADTKEFNEDGSFIGQYGVINTPTSETNSPVTPLDEVKTPINPEVGNVV